MKKARLAREGECAGFPEIEAESGGTVGSCAAEQDERKGRAVRFVAEGQVARATRPPRGSAQTSIMRG